MSFEEDKEQALQSMVLATFGFWGILAQASNMWMGKLSNSFERK